MDQKLLDAYQLVIADLGKRSEQAQTFYRNRPNRRWIQSIENARAVLVREAGLEGL